MRVSIFCVLAILSVAGAAPAAAEVAASGESGFVSHNEAVVPVPPDEAWQWLTSPGLWWNGDHTYSGDSANMTLNAAPGGCFCETMPGSDGPDGAIEHMRVIYAAPHATLRLSGALGPLQSEAVTGVLTMTLRPDGNGTRIAWDYVVGGYMRTPIARMAPLVDQVVAEQLQRLAATVRSAGERAGADGEF